MRTHAFCFTTKWSLLKSLILSAGLHTQGGGIDCSQYGEKDYKAEYNGLWMRVQSFRSWIETLIHLETFPGENLSLTHS